MAIDNKFLVFKLMYCRTTFREHNKTIKMSEQIKIVEGN